jgi:hypothetical protein
MRFLEVEVQYWHKPGMYKAKWRRPDLSQHSI